VSKIFKPTNGAEDWRDFLADPILHWKTGYSAKSMAYAWEENAGMPPRISQALKAAFKADVEALIVIPEYKVPLPGGRTQSQNDAFVFARIGDQTAVIMIEGKVEEPFGDKISKWFDPASKGKKERLAYLTQTLGLSESPLEDLRYQLFHRTASAIIEASRFKTDIAIMLVHSFSQSHKWFDDYLAFAEVMKCDGVKFGIVVKSELKIERPLYLGWVTGDPIYLTR
jgi:hypothetical protein